MVVLGGLGGLGFLGGFVVLIWFFILGRFLIDEYGGRRNK